MAKAKETNPVIEELKKLVSQNKLILGADRGLEGLKKGKVARIYLCSNYPTEKVDDIKHYANLSGAEVVELEVPNDELGTICRKTFSVAVLSLMR